MIDFEPFLDALVERLAPAVAAELAETVSAAAGREEPWRLLDLEEASERLGRSTRWVRERVTRGELPHVRLDGGALAFEVADLQAFAAERRVDATVSMLAERWQPATDAARGQGLRGDRQPPRLRVSK